MKLYAAFFTRLAQTIARGNQLVMHQDGPLHAYAAFHALGGRRDPGENAGWTAQAGPWGQSKTVAGGVIRRQLRGGTWPPSNAYSRHGPRRGEGD